MEGLSNMNGGMIFIISVTAIVAILVVLCVINSFCTTKGKFFCKYFGWHKTPKDITLDGINFKGKCPRCGKEVLRDSNGDWF